MAEDVPATPDIDANGIDRAEIRAMLARSPEERLRILDDSLASTAFLQNLVAQRLDRQVS